MPYTRKFRRQSRRTSGAEDKVARRAKHRKSAKAQSKQIISLAKSINYIKEELKDHTVPVMWENNLQQTGQLKNHLLGNPLVPDTTKASNICVIPLTSIGDPDSGAVPNTQTTAPFPSLVGGSAHTPVQPFGRDVGDTNQPHVGASWMKLYSQRVNMCFRSYNLQVPVRFRLFVVRLAKPDESSNSATLIASRRCIDGENMSGCPQSLNDFSEGRDFYASDSITPIMSGVAGSIDNKACALFSLNPNKYFIEHSRSFTLGPRPRRLASTSTDIQPYLPAAQSTPEARDYYECSFKINYGGVKISAPNHKDESTNKEESQTIMDIKYNSIRPDILRWVVVAPDISTMDTPVTAETSYGAPVYTLRSTIMTRVPA